MKILACDTTTSVNTVALLEGQRVLAETYVDCGRRHAEGLLETVEWVLRETGLTLEAVNALAVSVGPGSFTGVRVGVATWKGLALARGLPLMGVPTLAAMTRLGAFQNGVVCPMLDAKMGEVFGAAYVFEGGHRRRMREDRVGPVESLLEGLPPGTVFVGEGALLYRDRIVAGLEGAAFGPELHAFPRASAVGMEARELYAQGARADASEVTPVYLRKSQAEENRQKAGG